MKTPCYAALAAALALSACGDTAEDDTAVVDPAATETVAATDPATTDPAVPANPQQFVEMAAASDLFEIEAGRLAQDMGTSQAVRDFGAMMVEEHTRSTENLRQAAAEAQPAVTVAPALNAEQRAQIDALRGAGENFDATYAAQQVAAHERALAMLRGYAGSGDGGPLQAFASDTAPVVERHLEQARALPGG